MQAEIRRFLENEGHYVVRSCTTTHSTIKVINEESLHEWSMWHAWHEGPMEHVLDSKTYLCVNVGIILKLFSKLGYEDMNWKDTMTGYLKTLGSLHKWISQSNLHHVVTVNFLKLSVEN